MTDNQCYHTILLDGPTAHQCELPVGHDGVHQSGGWAWTVDEPPTRVVKHADIDPILRGLEDRLGLENTGLLPPIIDRINTLRREHADAVVRVSEIEKERDSVSALIDEMAKRVIEAEKANTKAVDLLSDILHSGQVADTIGQSIRDIIDPKRCR